MAIALLPMVGHFAVSSGNGVSAAPASALTLPASFASFLFVAWIVGAGLGLLHVAHGLYRLRRLRATCSPMDSVRSIRVCKTLSPMPKNIAA